MLKKFFTKEAEKVCHDLNGIVYSHTA